MSVRSLTKVAFGAMSIALMAVSLQSVSLANNLFGNGYYEGPRMATFDSATGETSFALSLSPQVDTTQRASDIVVYVDTSASQTGVYKRDSIETLKLMLGSLNVDDRVKLVAIDLDPIVLTKDFVGPASPEMEVAIENLKQRVSLGSTDVNSMLQSSVAHFQDTRLKNKNVIYIGDGVTRGSFLKTNKFSTAIKTLVENQVSVSSYVIGPERNVELLAALANHTGGNFYLDSDDDLAMKDGAIGLAQTVHGSVFWPVSSQLPGQVAEAFPRSVPPMRTDRDTILVGTLKDRSDLNISIEGQIHGVARNLDWTIKAEASNDDFSFLPQLVDSARGDQGMSLPTAGSNGLREAGRVILAKSRELTNMSGRALASGDVDAARELAGAALKSDPVNTEAELVSSAVARYPVQEDDPFGDGGDAGGDENDPFGDGAEDAGDAGMQEDDPFGDEPMADEAMTDEGSDPFGDEMQEEAPAAEEADPFGDEPAETEEEFTPPQEDLSSPPMNDNIEQVPSQPGEIIETPDSFQAIDPIYPDSEVNSLLDQGLAGAVDLAGDEEDRIKVLTEKLTAQVQFELTRAREEMATAPGQAIDRMKNMIDILDQTTSIDPNQRQDLRNRLVSGLMTGRQRKLEFDDDQALANENMASALEYRRTIREYERKEEQMSQLINRFNSLLADGNFDEGRDVTYQALQLDPNEPAAVVADESSRVARAYQLQYEIRRLRQLNLLAALYETEKSSVAFSGNPPLVFPDAQEWARKKALRAKYSDVRLTGNDIDEEILRALDEPASFDFDEVEFQEIMDDLRDRYKINVVLDSSARDDALTEDQPITFKVSGIRLKNALRLMLKEQNATFIVRDEVLRIISLDVATDPEYFVTNVYNVGDLVAPRSNPGGGGFGGGQGGGGQGGGGQGGGGQGGGGGGGVFCIDDSLTSTTSEPAANKVSSRRQPSRTLQVEIQPGQSQLEAWSNYFEKNHAAPRDVRSTIRRMMKKKDSQQVVAVVQAALKNNQAEPWMYEALVLAMQISGSPQAEVERAMMSVVDLATNDDDILIAANYMANNGMEKRAVRLLQDIADPDAIDPEPFVIGLSAAQRINDLDGIQWATLGILSKAWPKNRHVVKKAIFAAESARKELTNAGRTADLQAYNKQLDEALYRDCIIKVSWTGDADIDIFVEEPGGTVCSRQTPRTTAGGILMGDSYAAHNQKGEMTEYYVLPKGFSGDYRLLIRKVWGEVTAGKVSVSIYNHFRTEKEASQQKMLEVDEKGTLVLFELKEGRLEQAFDDHKIQTIADEQFVMNRRVLAQELANGYSATAASEYYQNESEGGSGLTEQQGNREQLNSEVRRPGAVGYRPEISQFFEGSSMFVNHATTADRLYVMVSVSPFFTQITRVDTFNIFGSAQNAGGTGGGGAGGGGGGVGGGGGGGLM